MPEEQLQTCVLRTLTLCDGQEAASVPPRALEVPCYCAHLEALLERGQAATASNVRTERARVVARSDEIERIRYWRQRGGDW